LAGISWWTLLWTTGRGIVSPLALLAIMGDRLLTVPLWMVALGAVVLIARSLFPGASSAIGNPDGRPAVR